LTLAAAITRTPKAEIGQIRIAERPLSTGRQLA
jgi:hypothetical protein